MKKKRFPSTGMSAIVCALLLTLTACANSETQDLAEFDLTQVSEEEYLDHVAEAWADYFNVEEPPVVEVVRYVGSEEQQQIVHDCTIEAGFTESPYGGFETPEEQLGAFKRAQYICYMQYPLNQKYVKPWGLEEKEKQYDWTVNFVIPCLQNLGYTIDDEVPSKAVFVDQYEYEPYFPFSQLEGQVSASNEDFNTAWADLENSCPQMIPDQILWDGMTQEQWAALR